MVVDPVQMGWWDWVGVAAAGIGTVAFIMAAPSILQMIWGKPQLHHEFDKYVEQGERVLIVYLKNPPIRKGSLLNRVCVRREAVQSLTVQFRLVEIGSNRILDPIRHAKIYADDQLDDNGAWRVALPPTYECCFVVCACSLG